MRAIIAVALLAALAAAGPSLAANTAQQGVMKSCSAKWTAMSAADKGKTKHNDFMSSCMKAPATTAAAAAAPAMAMKPAATGSMAMTAKPAAGAMAKPAAAAAGGGQAKCKDGTTVTYKTRSGTCSGHKGVATWM
jgi:hypothetical protein